MVSLNFNKPSILRNVLFTFLAFGLAMGLIFPIFADLFANWKEGMYIWFVVACIVAGLLIGIINYLLLNIMLLKKLQRIGDVADAISNNDITLHCHLESNDFIGLMATSFNRMAGNLRGMVSQIADVSKQLNISSSELHTVTNETEVGIEKQQKEVDHVTGFIQNMTNTSSGMSIGTQSAFDAAKNAELATKQGLSIVDKAVHSIHTLSDEIEQNVMVVKNLQADSENIGGVLSVIKDIAEQTNLLALNAAIEAARAGEHGRGFAVVADEVRLLASKTQDSTKKIEDTIEKLQNASSKAVERMVLGKNLAEDSIQKTNEAGNSLKGISTAVSTIYQMNHKIAKSSEDQKQQSDKIKNSILEINTIAKSVSKGAEKTLDSSNQVEDYSKQLNNLMKQFKF